MNNGNNSKSVENNMESDVDTTVIILDDTNKINDSERRTKENLGRQYCKTYSRLGNNKKTRQQTESLRETIFWLQS